MVTVLVALALIAMFPLVGLLVGLGSDRFWWLVGCIWLAVAETFVAGCAAGEWVREQATKAWRRAWKR